MVHDLPPTPSAELLEVAGPDLYANNPFRVLELTAAASPREVRRQADILMRAGKAPQPGPLALDPPPGEDAIREARDRLLREPERRLVAEMFWFSPREQPDEGVTALVAGDVGRALAHWTTRRHSDSLAVLCHARALDIERGAVANGAGELASCWQQAYEHWTAVQNSDAYWERLRARIAELDDPRLTSGVARRMRDTLPLALLSINAGLAVRAAQDGNADGARRHLAIMAAAGFGQPARDEALRRALEPVRESIKGPCDDAVARMRDDHERGLEVCHELLGVTEQPLAALEWLASGAGEPGAARTLLDTLREEIALTLRVCANSYGNVTSNWEPVHRFLTTAATAFATTPSTRSRLLEDLEIVEDNITSAGGRIPKPAKRKPAKAPKAARPQRPKPAPPAPRSVPAPARRPAAPPVIAALRGDQDEGPGTCWFCGRAEGLPGLEIDVDMHGEMTGSGAALTWEEGQMPVSRCESCAGFHSKLTLSWVPSIIFWVAAVAAIALAVTESASGALLVSGLTLIWVLRLAIRFWLLADYGPSSSWPRRVTDTSDYPPIVELRQQGWQLGTRPPAAER